MKISTKDLLRVHFALESLAFCVLHINNSIHRTKATPKPPKRIQQKALRKRARRIPQEWHHDNFFPPFLFAFLRDVVKTRSLESLVCVCLSVHSVDLQDFFPFQFTRSPSLQIFPTKKLFTRNFKQKKIILELKSQHIKNLRVCKQTIKKFGNYRTKIAQLIRCELWKTTSKERKFSSHNDNDLFFCIFLWEIECGVSRRPCGRCNSAPFAPERLMDSFFYKKIFVARLSDCYDIVCEEEVRQWIYGNINTDNDNNVRECKYWNKIFRWKKNVEKFSFIGFFFMEF